ncbi:SLC13 family permease [Saccharopolyspora taberi]|uniref:SLC13 family permease n=1 Tax=Saccharopolyspora taberi TaxID=60895 RepID=A0ABN3VIJ4_9PSEU
MSEILPVIALGVMFVVATVLPINIGILAFIAAFLVGTSSLGLTEDEILEGFPVSLFVTIVGVTYLFAVAQRNGTVELLVRGGVKLVRGKVTLIPWVLFALCGTLSALGTFPAAAIALLAPVGLKSAQRHGMSQLLIGALLVAGAHAGSFSPIAVSGALVLGMIEQTPLHLAPHALFLANFTFNVLIAVVSFLVLRGYRRSTPAEPEPDLAEDHTDEVTKIDWRQALTLAALVLMVVGALVFRLEIGFLALGAGALLALIDIKRQSKAIEGVSWSTVMLVGGMITYVGILEKAGTIDAISQGASRMGSPMLVALLLCFVVAVVSAFASSTAILATIIPIAVPLLLSSDLSAAGLVAALALSATIVDTSPFSSNGALVLSNASDQVRIYRQLLGYTAAIVVIGPLFAWGLLVVPSAL